jgi:hypothetical protein
MRPTTARRALRSSCCHDLSDNTSKRGRRSRPPARASAGEIVAKRARFTRLLESTSCRAGAQRFSQKRVTSRVPGAPRFPPSDQRSSARWWRSRIARGICLEGMRRIKHSVRLAGPHKGGTPASITQKMVISTGQFFLDSIEPSSVSGGFDCRDTRG